MSNRYKSIVGILDDDRNLACVTREILRRRKKSFLLPALPRENNQGWCFLRFRTALSVGGGVLKGSGHDAVIEVFPVDGSWFVCHVDQNMEIGPFDSPLIALEEAKKLAKAAGYTVLDQFPWDEEDLKSYPLKK